MDQVTALQRSCITLCGIFLVLFREIFIAKLSSSPSSNKAELALYPFDLTTHPQPPHPYPPRILFFSATAELVSIVDVCRWPQHKFITQKLINSWLMLVWPGNSSALACWITYIYVMFKLEPALCNPPVRLKQFPSIWDRTLLWGTGRGQLQGIL